MTAAKVLAEAKAAGVVVKLDGGKLKMKVEGTPPEEVIATLKRHRDEIKALLEAEEARDTFEERAAIVEFDGGAPRPWAEALARLDSKNPPGDVPLKRWLQFIDDAGRFVDDGWASKAEALGWTPLMLFGCDAVKPYARLGRAGLLWALEGRKLAELTADEARIIIPGGRTSGFYPKTMDPGGVLVWELEP